MRAWAMGLALVLGVAVVAPPSDVEARIPSCQRRRARHARPRITAAQRLQIQRWHRAVGRDVVRRWERQEPPPLVLVPLRGGRFVVPGEAALDETAAATVAEALAHRDGAQHPIHPRLVALLYRTVRRFHSPFVHVISGYRPGRPSSRHGQGRAIDFVLPGVADRRVASYVRSFGFVGVGIYPTSGFVHLDVRARSHFWSDASGPDQPNRERPILASLGWRYDAQARRRGEEAVPDVEGTPERGGEESRAAAEPSPAPARETSSATVAAPGSEGSPTAPAPVGG